MRKLSLLFFGVAAVLWFVALTRRDPPVTSSLSSTMSRSSSAQSTPVAGVAVTPRSEATAPRAAPPPRPASINPLDSRWFEDPEYEALARIYYTWAVFEEYGLILDRVSPESREALIALLVSRRLDSIVIDRVIEGGRRVRSGSDEQDLLISAQVENAREYDGKVRNLLSEEDYAAFKEYEQFLPEKEILKALSAKLVYRGSVLTTEQVDAFIASFATVYSPETIAQVRQIEERRQGALERLREILNPVQVVALEEALEEKGAGGRRSQLVRRHRESTQTRPVAP